MTDKIEKEITPPSTPPITSSNKEVEKEDLKFEKSLTENLNKRFYSNNNNNNNNNKEGEEEKEEINYNKFKTLSDFGYKYNENGELRTIEGNEKFKFVNQQHYDRLGDIIVDTIQGMMKSEPYNLQEVWIPKNEENQCNIFLSKDFYENKSRLMVLINGSGAVKSGQWARSLCINDSLNSGSILPYLKDASENGFSIIVLNPNFNKVEEKEDNEENEEEEQPLKKQKKQSKLIKYNENSNNHVLYVNDEFISKSPAEEIVIVAHSYGGINTVNLLDNRNEELKNKLIVIGFTDSVHSISNKSNEFTKSFFSDKNKTKNWVRSDKPVDTDLGFSKQQGCHLASAGHSVHEFTSSTCRIDLFKFILKNLKSLPK